MSDSGDCNCMRSLSQWHRKPFWHAGYNLVPYDNHYQVASDGLGIHKDTMIGKSTTPSTDKCNTKLHHDLFTVPAQKSDIMAPAVIDFIYSFVAIGRNKRHVTKNMSGATSRLCAYEFLCRVHVPPLSDATARHCRLHYSDTMIAFVKLFIRT